MKPRPTRIHPLADEDAAEAQRKVLDSVRRPDGTVANIFRTLVVHPDLTRRWLVFGNHVSVKSTLSPRVRELVILRVGWLSVSDYEWGQHVLAARREGVTDHEIEQIKVGAESDCWNRAERAALAATDELHECQDMSDDTWRALRQSFDEQQCLDVVFTVGQYVLVCMALNTCGVERDPGVPGFDR